MASHSRTQLRALGETVFSFPTISALQMRLRREDRIALSCLRWACPVMEMKPHVLSVAREPSANRDVTWRSRAQPRRKRQERLDPASGANVGF